MKQVIKNNFIQIDEVREMEGLPPLGLDFVKLGLNDVLYYPQKGQVYTPNTNQTVDVEEMKGGVKGDKSGNTSEIAFILRAMFVRPDVTAVRFRQVTASS